MKLNKKGMTLLELLISIGLISIVLTFLFQLLVDLRRESENDNFAKSNQINKAEIITTIQNDLNNNTLAGIENIAVNNNIKINFYYIYKNGIKTTVLYSDKSSDNEYIYYEDFNNEKHAWKMKGATIDPCGLYTFYKNSTSADYYFKINIYLYNEPWHNYNNKDRNNAVDDIEITYSGKKENLQYNENYLTINPITNKNIGYCTN